jgi:hypothetical protein
MRTKQCMLIGTALCIGVSPISFDFSAGWVDIGHSPRLSGFRELDEFARRDGFEDWKQLRDFWEAEHRCLSRWSGILIRWTDFKLPGGAR